MKQQTVIIQPHSEGIPSAILTVSDLWTELQKQHKASRSPVNQIGAGISFEYQKISYFLPPLGLSLDAKSWEPYCDLIIMALDALGAENIKYRPGKDV